MTSDSLIASSSACSANIGIKLSSHTVSDLQTSILDWLVNDPHV